MAWCAATRSLCEIAGDLALADPRDIRPLQKLLLAPQNGQDIHFGEHEHLTRNEPAAIVFAHGDLFSKTASPCLPAATLAIFNWSDEPRTFEIHPQSSGLSNHAQWLDVDFYTEEEPQVRLSSWSITLPARSVRLSHLTSLHTDHPSIVDSNWAVIGVNNTNRQLALHLHGNAPEGFLLHWPFETLPNLVASNIYTSITSVQSGLYRVAPQLPLKAPATDWSIEFN